MMQRPSTATPSPLTKNVTPNGTIPINCHWRTGGMGPEQGRNLPVQK